MRLNTAQTQLIPDGVHVQCGVGAGVLLFGSRLDDTGRGGAVDLLVKSSFHAAVRQRALATMAFEGALNRPVGIVVQQRGTPSIAFARIARVKAQPLEATF